MSDSSTSSGAARGEPEELPLWKAALAWCDQHLVQELCHACAMRQQTSGFRPRDNPFPSRFDLGVSATLIQAEMAGVVQPNDMATDEGWRRAAYAVTQDFLRRFAAGEIEMEGLQVRPRLKSNRTCIPTAWSSLLTFDWTKGTVTATNTVYFDVTGRCRKPQASAVATAENALGHQPRPAVKKGRPSFPMEAMVEIAVGRLHGRKSNKEETEILLRLFIEHFPDKRPPMRSTITKHLPEIYGQAARAERALKGRK
jgi:hypothetical protein